MSNPRLPHFQGVRPHHRADKCITREENNQVVIYGPQCDLCVHFWLFGGEGAGWPFNYETEPILLLSYPLYLYQSTYKIWKQSIPDFLSYRFHEVLSNDD